MRVAPKIIPATRHASVVCEPDPAFRGLTVAGCHVPFADIGSAVLKMMADMRGVKINDADKKGLTDLLLCRNAVGLSRSLDRR
jgi:hypothetical protein